MSFSVRLPEGAADASEDTVKQKKLPEGEGVCGVREGGGSVSAQQTHFKYSASRLAFFLKSVSSP